MLKRHLAGVLVSATIVGGGVAAVAAASPGDSSETTALVQPVAAAADPAPGEGARPPREGRRQHGPALIGRAVHGDLIVRDNDGGFENVTVDRGVVESKDGSKLTLKRPDGVTVTVDVTDDTRYRGVESLEQVRTGAPAVVVSKDGKARAVAQRPEGARPRGNKDRQPAVEG